MSLIWRTAFRRRILVCFARQASQPLVQRRVATAPEWRRHAAPHSWRPPRRWQRSPPARRPASGRWRAANPGPSAPWLSTGTPSTGRVVMLATMPGRCAAPPAPAMITLRPRAAALLGIGGHAVGGAMGGDDAGLMRHAQRVQHIGGGLQGGPVGLAAHDDADGAALGMDHASNRLLAGRFEEAAQYRARKPQGKGRLTFVNHSLCIINEILKPVRQAERPKANADEDRTHQSPRGPRARWRRRLCPPGRGGRRRRTRSDAVVPPPACWAFRKPNSRRGCATPSWG